jgi:hypothetical protein
MSEISEATQVGHEKTDSPRTKRIEDSLGLHISSKLIYNNKISRKRRGKP